MSTPNQAGHRRPHAAADVDLAGSVDLDRAAGHRRWRAEPGAQQPSCSTRRPNPNLLKGKKIAICCTNGVEEVEILGAQRWLSEHGATVHIVSPRIGEFHPTLGLRFPPQCRHPCARHPPDGKCGLAEDRHATPTKPRPPTMTPSCCRVAAGIPDALRMDQHAAAVRAAPCMRRGKPTTAICHGQWVMVSGRDPEGQDARPPSGTSRSTSRMPAPTVLDEPCVVDGNLITARFPYDLPRLVQAMVKQLLAGKN